MKNFAQNGDEGEVWFGEDSLDRVLKWFERQNIPKETTSVLDIGCGNGITPIHLCAEGYKRVYGVDYSASAVDLARKVASKRNVNPIFEEADFLERNSAELLRKKYDICLDKGTYDAVSLCPDDSKGKRLKYAENLNEILSDEGIFVITSCNWTQKELVEHFGQLFALEEVIPTPQIQFGGIVGNTFTILVFRKK